MSSEAQRVGPVSLSERILFIDVLRGMALFGILAANMRAFFLCAARLLWPDRGALPRPRRRNRANFH